MTEPHSLTLAESDFDPDALELIVTVPHDEADSDTDELKLGDDDTVSVTLTDALVDDDEEMDALGLIVVVPHDDPESDGDALADAD